ncbi:glycosyltransferase, exosortase A system-associated [Emcibacteraceae bacterium]|nr:glycosyltransferase, exosortase A system-associated [Emcibacteraceae bacterium]
MRVLHVFDHSIPLHSGYTFRSFQILSEQRKLGIETLHVTSIKHTAPYQDKEEVEGLEFYRTKPGSPLLNKLPIVNQWNVVRTLAMRIEEIVKTEEVDIIHAHSPVLNGLAALKVGKKYNIPVHYEIRAFWEDASVSHGDCKEGDMCYNITKSLETHVVKNAASVTTICDGLKQDLISRGISDDKITLIPNAVDISKFSGPEETNRDLQERLNIVDMTVLGFIGSFYDYEGIDILLRSMRSILHRVPNACLLLVGGGPMDDYLKGLADKLLLGDRVIFTGRVPHNKVQDYYNLVDIFVYPRKKMRLTDLVTPLKPLEAMAQHKLVAASDIGGYRELIEDGKTGVLFEPDNPIALACKIGDLVERKDEWPTFHKAGRYYVEEVRNWKNSVSNYPAIYERITAK